MEWGQYAESVAETSPDASTLPFMQSRPELTNASTEIVEAFTYLSASRQIGMAAGPIPFSEIALYAEMTSQVDFWGFVFLVQQIDQEYVSIIGEKK